MSSNRDQLDSLSGSWSVCSVTAGRDKSTVGMWSVFRGLAWFTELPYSFHCRHRSFLRSIFSLMHTAPQSIWPVTDFLVCTFQITIKQKAWSPNIWQADRQPLSFLDGLRHQKNVVPTVTYVGACSAAPRLLCCFRICNICVFDGTVSSALKQNHNDPKHTTKPSSGQWRT